MYNPRSMKYALLLAVILIYSCRDNSPSSSPKQVTIRDSTLLKTPLANPYAPVDVSPMDMVYFPTDFPFKKMNAQVAGMPVMRVIYSRPHRGGRQLFGSLLKFGEPWRLGANEATEIQFFSPVTIANKKVEKGQYIMYAIPFEDKWTLVLNNNLYAWGLRFIPADDVIKFDVPVTIKSQVVEHFTITFEKTPAGADLIMTWETTEVRLPIQF